MRLRFREAWRVLVSRSPDASVSDASAVAGGAGVRGGRSRSQRVLAWLDARPVAVAYAGVSVSFMGCFVAPLAPLGWWLSFRARAGLVRLDGGAVVRARSAATWGVRMGAFVTVLAGVATFLLAVGALV